MKFVWGLTNLTLMYGICLFQKDKTLGDSTFLVKLGVDEVLPIVHSKKLHPMFSSNLLKFSFKVWF